MPQEVIALWEQSLQRILQTCQEDRIEFSLLTPDGLKYYQSRGVPELAADNSIKSILRISRDITRNKQTEEALRESEERCRTVFEFAPIGIAFANKNGILSQINQAFQDILGYTQQELENLPFTEFTHPDDQLESLRLFQELVEGKHTHFSQEKRYLRKDGRMVWGNVSVSAVCDANGSFQYAIAMLQDISAQKQAQLELQNAHAELEKRVTERTLELAQANTRLKQEIAERCQVQEALQAQRNFFQTVIDTNPNSIFVKDRDDKFVLTNQAFADFYGITVEELLGQTTAELHPYQSDAERFLAQDEEVFTTLKQKLILEELVCTPARGMRWLQTIKKPIFSSDGQVYQVLGVSADITERKLAEEALKAQKEFLQTIIDNNPNQIFVKDRYGRYVLANQAFAEFHGRTVEEIVGFTDIQLTPHQAELEEFLAQDREVVATSRQKLIAEQIDRTSTGEIRWFQVIKKPLLDGEGRVCQILGVSTDITQRKLAEEQLRQSEQRLHLALKAAHMGFWDWHLPTGKVTRSSDLEQMLGWVPNSQKDTKNDFLATVHPEDRDRLCQVEQHCLETGQECELEFRIIWPDGSIRWMESKSRILYDTTGKPLGMTGINLDITERKQAQIALKVQHELLQTVIDANPNLIFVKDIEGKFVLANQTYANYCGVPIEELLGKSDADLNPNGFDVQQYTAQDREVFATLQEIVIPEDICHSITGEVRWFQTIKKPLFDRDGQVYQVLGVSTDITQHKLTQEKLRQSEEQLRLALQAADIGFWDWNLQTGILSGSDRIERMLNRTPDRYARTYETFLASLHPDDRDRVIQADQRAIETGENFDIEFRIVCSDGTIRWIEDKGQVIYDETGKPLKLTGVNLDISERKFAEEQLRQSEEQLRLALEAAGMDGWNWDFQTGKITGSSNSNNFRRLYGYDPKPEGITYEESLEIVHPEDRERVRQADRYAIETGDKYDIEFRMIGSDGSIRWLESKGQVIYSETGKPIRMIGINLDISDRKQAETEIKESLREKEVLLQEIHHRVKNNLQVISSLLDLQSQRLKDTATLEMFQESQNRIKLMALVHETLYKSKDFAKINFSEYVQNLASYLFRAYKVEASNIALELNLDEVHLKLDQAIPCGLIISELVSNSLKYAFPNQTNGNICIITKSDKNKHFKIIVMDNGVGFPIDLNFHSLNSLGLQLVNVLIEQIEGTLEIDTSRGTKFTISFSELSD
jgi:PAS domain S-box-containing protein